MKGVGPAGGLGHAKVQDSPARERQTPSQLSSTGLTGNASRTTGAPPRNAMPPQGRVADRVAFFQGLGQGTPAAGSASPEGPRGGSHVAQTAAKIQSLLSGAAPTGAETTPAPKGPGQATAKPAPDARYNDPKPALPERRSLDRTLVDTLAAKLGGAPSSGGAHPLENGGSADTAGAADGKSSAHDVAQQKLEELAQLLLERAERGETGTGGNIDDDDDDYDAWFRGEHDGQAGGASSADDIAKQKLQELASLLLGRAERGETGTGGEIDDSGDDDDYDAWFRGEHDGPQAGGSHAAKSGDSSALDDPFDDRHEVKDDGKSAHADRDSKADARFNDPKPELRQPDKLKSTRIADLEAKLGGAPSSGDTHALENAPSNAHVKRDAKPDASANDPKPALGKPNKLDSQRIAALEAKLSGADGPQRTLRNVGKLDRNRVAEMGAKLFGLPMDPGGGETINAPPEKTITLEPPAKTITVEPLGKDERTPAGHIDPADGAGVPHQDPVNLEKPASDPGTHSPSVRPAQHAAGAQLSEALLDHASGTAASADDALSRLKDLMNQQSLQTGIDAMDRGLMGGQTAAMEGLAKMFKNRGESLKNLC
ncbi:hypothetical protein HLB44_15920 [Aquincola sp. S2]|uniref:Uncharacterized protein n=1 Tax=Pseudaquabacterium terrae TaxID=2732868 RepID=A0ABX2EIS2_9BURK|nr:hypothetical protein [Aquabacterium terrae]NRF68482.1 hypothetical protein [Aquabacterium terrae]